MSPEIKSLLLLLASATLSHLGGAEAVPAASTAADKKPAEPAKPKVTMEHLTEKVTKIVKDLKCGPKVKELMKDKFGSIKVSEAKPAQFAAIAAGLDQIITDAEAGGGDEEY